MTNQERIQRLDRVRTWLVLRSRRENADEQAHIELVDEVLEDLRRELRGGLHVLKTPVDEDEERELALLRTVGEMTAERRGRLLEHVLDIEGADGFAKQLEDWLAKRRAVARRIGSSP